MKSVARSSSRSRASGTRRRPSERALGSGGPVAIDNPIINSPFVEPARHFVSTTDGTVTGEIDDRRRPKGRAANYVPDFLIRLRDQASTGPTDLLTLMLEVTGEAKKEKQAKVATAEQLWVEAVNNWAGLGRWAFLEVTDPWDAENLIRTRYLTPWPTEAEAPA